MNETIQPAPAVPPAQSGASAAVPPDAPAATASPAAAPLPPPGTLVRRHRASTRLWHWLNVVAVTVMLMSGLMIFNAHPRLYWGQYGADPDAAWLEISAQGGRGLTRVFGAEVTTTGVLGVVPGPAGPEARAFPGWMTIPTRYSLADARLWHLAFAWVLALGLLGYLGWSLLNGHLRRDLHITAKEWAPRHLWQDVKDHARLRFPTGAAALRYNVLQKLAYGGVLFVLLPLLILTGLTMSPALNAGLAFLPDVFGGRQSARSLHFLAALGLVGFVAVHLAMVILAGPINEVRSMITGMYRLPGGRSDD